MINNRRASPSEQKKPTPPNEIPASGWAYVDSRNIKLLPEGAKFQPGLIYDFRTRKNPNDSRYRLCGDARSRVVPSLPARDSVGNANPIAANEEPRLSKPHRHRLLAERPLPARSYRPWLQSGRVKAQVFDGVLVYTAGVGRVFANTEFGQPNRTNTQHEDHHFPENHFPFAHTTLTDPLTGKTGALLRGDGLIR